MSAPCSSIGVQAGLDARVAQLAGSARELDADQAVRASQAGHNAEAAEKFEELFATMLVKEMRKGLSDGFFGKGPGADVFDGWLDAHVGGALASSGGLGLAGMIKANLGLVQPQDQESRP